MIKMLINKWYLNIRIGYVEVTEQCLFYVVSIIFWLSQSRRLADIAPLYLARFFGPLKQKLTIGLLVISIPAISHDFIKTENRDLR
jgi:hypothetical protein